MINKVGNINKNWGFEQVIHSTNNFCVKKLYFEKAGNYFSYHQHKNKLEEWTVEFGSFQLEWAFDPSQPANVIVLKQKDVFTVTPGMWHRLVALQDRSLILEVSTADHAEDNHRLLPSMPKVTDNDSNLPVSEAVKVESRALT